MLALNGVAASQTIRSGLQLSTTHLTLSEMNRRDVSADDHQKGKGAVTTIHLIGSCRKNGHPTFYNSHCSRCNGRT